MPPSGFVRRHRAEREISVVIVLTNLQDLAHLLKRRVAIGPDHDDRRQIVFFGEIPIHAPGREAILDRCGLNILLHFRERPRVAKDRVLPAVVDIDHQQQQLLGVHRPSGADDRQIHLHVELVGFQIGHEHEERDQLENHVQNRSEIRLGSIAFGDGTGHLLTDWSDGLFFE